MKLVLVTVVVLLGAVGHPPRPETRPTIQIPEPKAKIELRQSFSRSVKGKASWYCSNEIPICHHQYPPGSMVAAACGKLRHAMGKGWRGKAVRVRSGDRSITVKLVDWCGSEDKLIDLYREPMRRLGGSGVLRVEVSW